MEVLVFGGTVEGRQIVEWLEARGTCKVVACTATDYGARLLEGGSHVTVLRGPLSQDDKRHLMESHDFECVVDATHPYATHISQSIAELAQAYGKDVVRVVRDPAQEGTWVSVRDAHEAAAHLSRVPGNILLTTGSKDLATYVEALADYRDRLFIRILPVMAALDQADKLGIPTSHVIAMQGPCSEDLNKALIRQLDISWLVTKQSGASGGFEEKIRAAEDCGIGLVVISRPCEEEGLTFEEALIALEERYGL